MNEDERWDASQEDEHDENFEADIPSRRIALLKDLVNQEIIGLTRYSWSRPDEIMAEYGLEASDVFSKTAGALLMTVRSGLTVGFGYIPESASVSVWTERTADGRESSDSAEDDEELFPVDAADPVYSRGSVSRLVGQRIASVRAFRAKCGENDMVGIPREAGLLFETEDGLELFISRSLIRSPDDFCVVSGDEVPTDVWAKLTELFRLHVAVCVS